jgi:hypothetical protein
MQSRARPRRVPLIDNCRAKVYYRIIEPKMLIVYLYTWVVKSWYFLLFNDKVKYFKKHAFLLLVFLLLVMSLLFLESLLTLLGSLGVPVTSAVANVLAAISNPRGPAIVMASAVLASCWLLLTLAPC